jgi:hypothetical protein
VLFPTRIPLRFVLVALAGWMNQQQRDVIDYLQEENRVLREQLGPRPTSSRLVHFRSSMDERRADRGADGAGNRPIVATHGDARAPASDGGPQNRFNGHYEVDPACRDDVSGERIPN